MRKLDGYVGCKSRRLGEEVKRSGRDVSVVEEHYYSFRGGGVSCSGNSRVGIRPRGLSVEPEYFTVLTRLACECCSAGSSFSLAPGIEYCTCTLLL